jgi:hypothetical protein
MAHVWLGNYMKNQWIPAVPYFQKKKTNASTEGEP